MGDLERWTPIGKLGHGYGKSAVVQDEAQDGSRSRLLFFGFVLMMLIVGSGCGRNTIPIRAVLLVQSDLRIFRAEGVRLTVAIR